MASQTSVMAVGRVVCDAEAATARLNESSVLLEGCIDPCQGVRVRLDLRHLPSFSLFPGQILAVEGSNPSGYCLVAKRIVAALPYHPVPSLAGSDGGAAGGDGGRDGEGGMEKGTEGKVDGDAGGGDGDGSAGDAAAGGATASDGGAAEVQEKEEAGTEGMDTGGVRAVESGAAVVKAEGNEEEEEEDGDEIRIIAAAGPFTTIDSWSFDPLKDLIRFALQRPPDVLLLIGPFIDREHPDARDGCVDQTYEALFQQHIRAQVRGQRK
ncbi:unnamed protein product [Closterium sp. Yama58-4]|nr:unnamed protein product [Closterium sp. Yama58-4]